MWAGAYTLSTSVLKYNAGCISLSSQAGLTHHQHTVNLNACLFQGETCKLYLCVCQCACCIFNMYQWCRACLCQALTPIWINQSFNLSAKSYLFIALWAPGTLCGSRYTKTVAQFRNRYHDNCCHPLDKKTPAPVNHGRTSESNVDDNNLNLSLWLSIKLFCSVSGGTVNSGLEPHQCGRKQLSSHSGHQEVGRCCTRGES